MLDVQLKVFKIVVDKGSFSLAANELHMTQSSVSQQIQSLENYYDIKLFDRMHRKIMVTQAGMALYPYAVELERLYQESSKAIQGLKADIAGKLSIGCSLTIGEYFMPRILVAFSLAHPLVEASMDVFNTEQITAMAVDGRISLGFIEGHYEPLDALIDTKFAGDELVVIASPQHKHLMTRMSLVELMGARWVMREKDSGTRKIFEEFVTQHGLDPSQLKVVLEMGSTQAVKEAVKSGIGITAISRLTVENEIHSGELITIPLQEGDIPRKFTMIYHKERFQTHAVERFMSYVMENTKK
ncbi:MAG: LysR substrate-binding domain-containing protein [Negativicutes bacterium]|nr:LysR substrate-binding domain-containing protein [Negativicutes bacterium]